MFTVKPVMVVWVFALMPVIWLAAVTCVYCVCKILPLGKELKAVPVKFNWTKNLNTKKIVSSFKADKIDIDF